VKVDDERLITSSWDKTIKIWNSDTLAPIKTIKIMQRVECFDYKDDLIVCGCTDGDLRIRRMSNNSNRALSTTGWVSVVELHGDRILSGSAGDALGQLRSWNIETGDYFDIQGPTTNVLTLKCYNNIVISGGLNQKVFISDLRTGKASAAFNHNSSVKCIELYNDLIISGGANGTVCIWDSRCGTIEPLFKERIPSSSAPVAALCSGNAIIAASDWNKDLHFIKLGSTGFVKSAALPLHTDKATALAANSTRSKLVSASCEEVLVLDYEPLHRGNYYTDNKTEYYNFGSI